MKYLFFNQYYFKRKLTWKEFFSKWKASLQNIIFCTGTHYTGIQKSWAAGRTIDHCIGIICRYKNQSLEKWCREEACVSSDSSVIPLKYSNVCVEVFGVWMQCVRCMICVLYMNAAETRRGNRQCSRSPSKRISWSTHSRRKKQRRGGKASTTKFKAYYHADIRLYMEVCLIANKMKRTSPTECRPRLLVTEDFKFFKGFVRSAHAHDIPRDLVVFVLKIKEGGKETETKEVPQTWQNWEWGEEEEEREVAQFCGCWCWKQVQNDALSCLIDSTIHRIVHKHFVIYIIS